MGGASIHDAMLGSDRVGGSVDRGRERGRERRRGFRSAAGRGV